MCDSVLTQRNMADIAKQLGNVIPRYCNKNPICIWFCSTDLGRLIKDSDRSCPQQNLLNPLADTRSSNGNHMQLVPSGFLREIQIKLVHSLS
jgi:hypothetical protein